MEICDSNQKKTCKHRKLKKIDVIDQIDSIPVSAPWNFSIEGLWWIQFLERAEMRDAVLRDEKNY